MSFTLFKSAAGTMSIYKPNMLSFVFYFYLLIFSYIGTIIIATNDEYFNMQIRNISFDTTKFYVWLSVSYVLILLPIGIHISRIVFKGTNIEILFENYTSSKIEGLFSKRDLYLRFPLYILSFISVIIVLYVLYTVGLDSFLKAFTLEGQVELMILRREIDIGFTGNQYLRNIFGTILLPILTYTSFCYFIMSKRVFDFIWFSILFITTFLMLIHTLEKSPFIFFLMGFVFLYVLIKGRVSKLFLATSIASLFILMIGIYAFVTKNIATDDFEHMFSPFREGLVGRVLISQITSLYSHLETFPIQHEFIGNTSLSRFISSGFLSEHGDRSGRIILELYAPGWVELGYGGVFNTLFIGEAWANYGYAGLLLSPLWVGFLTGSCYYLFLSLKKTPIFLGLFTYYSYKTSISGGFNDYIYDAKVIIIIMIIASLLLVGHYLKKTHERQLIN